MAATSVTVPLEAITFVDDQHGWAVGQLGTIVATLDGGRNLGKSSGPPRPRRLRNGHCRARRAICRWNSSHAFARTQGYQGIGQVIGRNDLEAWAYHGDGDAPER